MYDSTNVRYPEWADSSGQWLPRAGVQGEFAVGRVSLGDDEKVLEAGGGDGLTQPP